MYERCLAGVCKLQGRVQLKVACRSQRFLRYQKDSDECVRSLLSVRCLYGVGAPESFASLASGGDTPQLWRAGHCRPVSTDATGPFWRPQSGENIGRDPAGRTSPCGLRNSVAGEKEAGQIQAGRIGGEPAREPVAQDEV